MSKIPKIVVIGGGAAGLELSTRLGNKLGKSLLAEITLIDPNLSYTWKPLWHEIAAGRIDVSKDKTEYLAQGDEHNFKFKLGALAGIDRERKLIHIKTLDYESEPLLIEEVLYYDILILAVGSIHNDFDTKGVSEFCLSFDTLDECDAFHKSLIINLFKLFQTDKKEINISIIGGGSTGVELAFEINNTLTKLLNYNSISNNNISINLNIIESAPGILNGFSEELVNKITNQLKAANIKIHSGKKVIKIDQKTIYTESGMQIKSDIKLWAAGIKAPEILTTLGLETNKKNQLMLKDTLQLSTDEHIFALGDCATFSDKNKSLPPTAQLAQQQAKFLAKSLTKYIKLGRPLDKFLFKKQGTIISTSKNSAVGELETSVAGKINLNKRFAYFSYRFLYRKFQASLYGWKKVIFLIIADFFTRRTKPSIKLH